MKLIGIKRFRTVGLCLLAWLALPATGHAGQLIFTNTSDKPITCKVDGFTKPITIPASVTIQRLPNLALSNPVINSVECGNVRTRLMNITPTGPDGILVFNGEQTRTLDVLLYPYIPTLQQGNFTALITYIVNTYQAQNPQVMLNAVMNPNIDIYDFPTLLKLAGPTGYHVLELDMSFLRFLVSNNLIAPVSIRGDQPWPVAAAAATWNGTLYGIPSWLCTNFTYYLVGDPANRPSWKDLRATVPKGPRLLVSDFDGSWTMPAMYLNSYVQTYGYANIKNAFTAPIDPTVIQNLSALATACNGDDGNPCIDGRYHNAPDGAVEKAFATGNAYLDIGFSERSFFVLLYQTAPGFLGAAPTQWAGSYLSTLLLYTDAFVVNRSRCTSGNCPGDSQAFTTLMTSAAMKSYIAFSQDLQAGTPPRHLLVATQRFWSLRSVQNDPLYQQFAIVLAGQPYTIQPFPNWFTPAQQQTMYGGVCDALKAIFPKYACTGTAPPTAH